MVIKVKILVLFFIFLSPFSTFSQNPKLTDIQEIYKAKISIHPSTSVARFLRFPIEQPFFIAGNDVEQKATNFLNNYGEIFGVKDPETTLTLQKNQRDNFGKSHLYFSQNHNGIPVYGSDLRLHFNENQELTAVNGIFIPEIYISPNPFVEEFQANQKALNIVQNQVEDYASAEIFVYESELKIFKKGLVYNQKGRIHLVYEIEIRNDIDVREFVFIDAHTGKLVEQYTGIAHAMHRQLYETNTNAGNQLWDEGDAFPASLDIWQQNELVAAEDMYNLFNNTFSYASYDGSDATMITVHNAASVACPNATWNGTSANYCTATASDDVVAHEWGHAYTEYTSGLIYAWQSGALNESYSDIWGETVDLLNLYEDTGEDLSLRTDCNNSLRWKMGEDASAFGGAIRDMFDPTCDGDPGKVTDADYHCSTGDSGGVHSNSGVNNHAYMLLVDGGTYNGQTISALGFTKAAHVFWRAQSVYLTSTSDFSDMSDALEASCADLLGVNLEGLTTETTAAGPSGEIITAADCAEVTQAIAAVEFRTAPNCNFTSILAQSPPNLCSSPLIEDNIFHEDFESGMGAFTTSQTPTNPGTWESREWVHDSSLPDSRSGSGVFGPDPINGNCASDLENGIITLISPIIALPTGRNSPIYLSFEHYVATEPNWDGGNLKHSINGGAQTLTPASVFDFNGYNGTINTTAQGNDNPLQGQAAFTGTDGGSLTSTWGKSHVNLTALGAIAGNTIQFFWEMGTDGCNGNDGWYVDNVQVFTCQQILPVELISFTASPKSENIILDWKTSLEIDNAGFELQRSIYSDKEFEKIAWINGEGNTVQPTDYQHIDKNIIANINYYYRLQQVDFNENISYSNIVSAKIKKEEKEEIVIYPNPAKDLLFFQNNNIGNEEIRITILNTSGQKIVQQKHIEKEFSINISDLAQGIYFIKINSKNHETIKKILITP